MPRHAAPPSDAPRSAIRRRRPDADHHEALAPLGRAWDAASIILAGVAAYALRHETFDMPERYLVAILSGVLIHQTLAGVVGAHRFDHSTPAPAQATGLFSALAATALLLVLAAYFTKTSDQFSRAWAGMWWSAALGLMIFGRLALAMRVRRGTAAGRPGVRVAVIGSGARAERVRRRLEGAGVSVAATIPADDTTTLPDRLASLDIDEAIIAGLPNPTGEPEHLLRALRAAPLRFRYALEPPFDALPATRLGVLGGTTVVELLPAPISGAAAALKRAEDVLFALALLIIAAPLIGAAMLAIRLEDGGPTLFRQQRRGFRGEVFTVLKLRTMAAEAASDPTARPATRGDRRVTRTGRFLRRWSVDELPQLFNVLRGDMSLVGPRPLALPHDAHFSEIVEGYAARRRMKPGLTGWAQANGLRGEIRSTAELEERLRHDLEYVEHWSVGFDLWILVLTAARMLGDKNAY